VQEAFPGATLEGLRELKAVYDLDDVFNQNRRSRRLRSPPRPDAQAARRA